MSDRDDILSALKDDLKMITPGADNYTSYIAEVKRGYYGWSDAVNKPLVCVVLANDIDEDDYIAAGQIRRLYITLYAFMDNDGMDNHDKVHALVRDIEYFLKYDFSYHSNTYVKKINMVEGGASAPYSYFDINLETVYQQDL